MVVIWMGCFVAVHEVGMIYLDEMRLIHISEV